MNKPYPLAALRAAGFIFLLVGSSITPGRGQAVVSTVAGSGAAGNTDGPALTAQFNQPHGVAVDAQGTAYVADRLNHVIRKITAAGVVSTLAGGGSPGYFDNPNGLFAAFSLPHAVLRTLQGDLLVADTGNGSIRKIDALGAVTTLAGSGVGGYVDGPAGAARFSGPIGLAQDVAGNVYVADADNYRIRRIDPNGNVTTIAGSGVRGHLDGPAATARFFEPQGIALDGAGNLYVADRAGNRIRKLTPAGVVSTYAGVATAGYVDGPAATARFNAPIGVAVDARGDVYVMDRDNQRLRRIEAATGLVSTVAGSGVAGAQDGAAGSAQFSSPRGIAIQSGALYVADLSNHRIRRVAGLPLSARAPGIKRAALQLEVFPNPVAGPATLRFRLPNAGRTSFVLYDVLGRTVAALPESASRAAGWHETRLELGSLPPGLYVGRLVANGQAATRQLIIAR